MHVIVRSPLRVSFFGGGTDFPNYFRDHGGAVCAQTINKYVYVSVKTHAKSFQERYRISYSAIETVSTRAEIQNDIIRGGLELMEIDSPLQVTTWADLPAGSGLGSSSAFSVALMLALARIVGRELSPGEAAGLACELELGHLGREMGVQDQYASAYGGLNLFEFDALGTSVRPLSAGMKFRSALSNSRLVWTGRQRDASSQGKANLGVNQSEKSASLKLMASQARDFAQRVNEDNVDQLELGALLSQAWELKRKTISRQDSQVEAIYSRAMNMGSNGGKLLGAGGGGFFLMLGNPAFLQRIDSEFGEDSVKFSPSGLGAQVVYLEN